MTHGRFIKLTENEIILEWYVAGFQQPIETNTIVEILLRKNSHQYTLTLNHGNIESEDSANAKQKARERILDEI